MSLLSVRSLTREGRDTLWLLAALAWCLAPHVSRLPVWCSIGTFLALAWRARIAQRDAPLPPRWLLFVWLTASMTLTWSTHHTLFGREAGITLIAVLSALKTLELRAQRDAFVVTCLGFFIAFTQFLYSQSILMALSMLLGSWALLSSLVLAQRPLGRPSIVSAMRAAGRSMAWGLPLMLALYVFFPRLGPLWNLPSDAGAKTGLSDRLRLGHVSELVQDDSIAMRVRFDNTAPPPDQMYFRGPVLSRFDGQVWSELTPFESLQRTLLPAPRIHRGQQTISYQVTLEPTRLHSLPLLDGTLYAAPVFPATMPDIFRRGLDWWMSRPLSERAQFKGEFFPGSRELMPEGPSPLEDYLQLPRELNPRTRAWSQALRANPLYAQGNARDLSRAVMAHIRHGGFSYTLSPEDQEPGPDGRPERHWIDRFWIDRKTGFCEHFATAYVVVMRNMGIPARVVTGFQGAERNMVDGLYVVRNSDAHAWAEYWQEGEGWVRADPTAAVAPERISRGGGQRYAATGLTAILNDRQGGWLKTWRSYLDAGNHRWNVWVLQYSGDRQIQLLKGWGVDAKDWSDLLRICAAILSVASLGGLMTLVLKRPRWRQKPWEHSMWQLHRSLSDLGLKPPLDCPAPAPALAWAKSLTSEERSDLPKDLREALLTRLQTLDALRYSSAASSVGAAPEKQAKFLIREIDHRVREHLRSGSSKK